jgi:hypothetical protein
MSDKLELAASTTAIYNYASFVHKNVLLALLSFDNAIKYPLYAAVFW